MAILLSTGASGTVQQESHKQLTPIGISGSDACDEPVARAGRRSTMFVYRGFRMSATTRSIASVRSGTSRHRLAMSTELAHSFGSLLVAASRSQSSTFVYNVQLDRSCFLTAAIERANEKFRPDGPWLSIITQFASGRFVVKDRMVTSDGRTTKAELKIASQSGNLAKMLPLQLHGNGNRQMISEARALRPTPPTCRNCHSRYR